MVGGGRNASTSCAVSRQLCRSGGCGEDGSATGSGRGGEGCPAAGSSGPLPRCVVPVVSAEGAISAEAAVSIPESACCPVVVNGSSPVGAYLPSRSEERRVGQE